jgi:hypothetical protein
MGQRARAMLEAHFTRRQALDRWSDVLDRVEHPWQQNGSNPRQGLGGGSLKMLLCFPDRFDF